MTRRWPSMAMAASNDRPRSASPRKGGAAVGVGDGAGSGALITRPCAVAPHRRSWRPPARGRWAGTLLPHRRTCAVLVSARPSAPRFDDVAGRMRGVQLARRQHAQADVGDGVGLALDQDQAEAVARRDGVQRVGERQAIYLVAVVRHQKALHQAVMRAAGADGVQGLIGRAAHVVAAHLHQVGRHQAMVIHALVTVPIGSRRSLPTTPV